MTDLRLNGFKTVPARRTLVAPAVVSACLVLACAAREGQPIDRSKPPAAVRSAGGFTSSRLRALPDIDGRNWIAAEKVFGPATVSAPNGRFTLTLQAAKANEDTGDLAGFRLYFAEGRAPAVEIGPAFTNSVFITGDSRWIITAQQFDAIDVANWRKYSLRDALKVEGFFDIRAVSADGRRLVIAIQPCPFDCQNVPNPDPYYEIQLP